MVRVEGFELPEELYYDRKEHLWARIEEAGVRVGLDMFGQKAAGTVVYIKIMPAGREVRKGRAFGSVEAGTYVGALKAPVNGKIAEVNEAVIADPGLVNNDPYGAGWFVVIEPSSLEDDLADLVHGREEIQSWLETEIAEYREKGWLEQ